MIRIDADTARRLASVAKTLETASNGYFAIDFGQLAHDIRAVLAVLSENDDE